MPRLIGVPLLAFAWGLSGLGYGWQHAERLEFTFACVLAFLGVGFCALGVRFIPQLIAAFGGKKNRADSAPSSNSLFFWIAALFFVLLDSVRDCG